MTASCKFDQEEITDITVSRKVQKVWKEKMCIRDRYEDAEDTLSGKSYFRTILHEMVNTLKKAGVEEILVKGRNSYAVLPDVYKRQTLCCPV